MRKLSPVILESKIEKEVCRYAEKSGWLQMKFISPSRNGVPDRIFMHPINGVIFIEFKQKNKKPSKIQQKVINDIKYHGVIVYIVDSIEMGKGIFNNVSKRKYT